MKGKTKRVLGSLLAVLMMSSLLGGCGGSNEQPKESGKPDQTAKETAGPAVTLTVEVFDRGIQGQPSLDNNQWTRYINDNFGKANNVNVKFVPVPRTQEIDKLNIMMAAGEAPDISFTYDQATIYKYVKNDGITQLDDLLPKHGSALSSYLGKNVLKYGVFGGKQMAIPAKRTLVAWSTAFIRQDWLDKLGLPVPTNQEELYNTLIAFRDKNPGGVNGVIPWGTAVGGSGSMYGFSNVLDIYREKQTEEQFATLPSWTKPGNKEGMRFLNKLYNEKLISPDFAIDKTGKQADADVTNGKVGFFSSLWDYPFRTSPGIYAALQKNVPTAKLTPVDVFKNSQGKYEKAIYSEYGMFVFIPKTSKNAVQAIKYLNWMADPKVTYYLQNGEEGVNHKLVDGLPQVIPQTGDKMMTGTFNGDYVIIVNGAEMNDPEKNAKLVTKGYGAAYEADVAKALKIGTADGRAGFFFDAPIEASTKYGKTLADKDLDMTAQLVYCKPADFDKLYDSLTAEYMAAGGQAVMEEKGKVYKAMQATNK